MEIFEKFDKGQLALPERVVDFNSLKWNEHPTFEGVALKHIVTAKDSGGKNCAKLQNWVAHS